MNLRVEIEARNLAAGRPIEWAPKDLSADTAEPAMDFRADARENNYTEARRQQESFLAPLEKKVLVWVAHRMPSWVNSDHLTTLGLLSMFLAGTSLGLTRWVPWSPLLVPLFLALNWFGDSLDGTLARVRNKQRPRYGYYVDHVVDGFNALFLLGGLALSGLMSPVIALSMLAVYSLLCIDSYLAAHAIGRFKVSYLKFSPTELRLLLALGCVCAWINPSVMFMGARWMLLDVAGIIATSLMLMAAIASVLHNTHTLYKQERV
jgi:archaetidylinositol phosphate synthase